MSILDTKHLAIVDVETTGGSPVLHRVIEVGVVRIEGGELVGTYQQLVNPGIPIPKFITEITGITDRTVQDAPHFETIAPELFKHLEGAVFVAHNALFDYSFLRHEFSRQGFGFAFEYMCTVRLSRALFPEHPRHNLSALIDRFELPCKNRHRALDDALAVWGFLQKLSLLKQANEIDTVTQKILSSKVIEYE